MNENSANSFLAAAAADESWLAANEDVIRLGLEWLSLRLSDGDAAGARAEYEVARFRMMEAGTPAAIDRLSATFLLSPFDEDVLLIALAPAIDGAFATRFGAAQGRLAASPATPHLVSLLLFASDRIPVSALRRLGPDGPLRAHDLISFDATAALAATASIYLPERVGHYLCGFDSNEGELCGRIEPLTRVPVPEALDQLAARLAATINRGPRLQIVGSPRSGRRALAAAILGHAGFHGAAITASADLAPLISVLAREALLGGFGLAVIVRDDPPVDIVRQLDRRLDVPVLLIMEQPIEGLEHIPVVRTAAMTTHDRAALWQLAAPDDGPDVIAQVAEQFSLGPNEIPAVAGHVASSDGNLWAACRDLGAHDLEALATRIVPQRCWDDIVLPDAVRIELKALAAQVTGRPQVLGSWGFREVLGRSTGITALFAGPSGVGKTMAAEVIAEALSLDLYTVDLARVTSKYIGETEKNLRRIFDAAEMGGAVLFFDEADALFGKRSEVKDSHDRYANAEISYLLQRMERYSGLAILATNLKSHLDTAFLRRLRMIVDFPMHSSCERKQLWQRFLPEKARGRIDWEGLCRVDLTGGNIATIATNAAFRAAADGEVVGMKHIQASLDAELRKLDREAVGTLA
ncbi:MAG: ATP-binding protein [Pseudomonadota bacterium]|nr:ATP-binding protein [Pseudomonadota bacterium]